jgi:hypothetical protein
MNFIRAIQKYNTSSNNWETIQSGSNTVLKTESTSNVPTDDISIELINGEYYKGVYYEEGDYFIADWHFDPTTTWICTSDLIYKGYANN